MRSPQTPLILAAARRVGLRAEDRLDWLQDLARAPTRKIADVRCVAAEVAVFVALGPMQTDPLNSPEVADGVLEDFAGISANSGPDAVPTRVVAIAKVVSERFLTDLSEHGRCILPFMVAETRWSPGRRATRIGGGGIRSRFAAAVFALFEELGERLAVCARPNCRRFFVRNGKRPRAYCGPRCSQYVRTATFRAKHPEQVKTWRREGYDPERRRRAYVKERQRALWPKVKVARRPRRLAERAGKAEV